MGLTATLYRYAAGRPRPIVVPVPGATGTRLLVEAELARRGWPAAGSPAAANALLVCGAPGPDLGAAIGTVWRDVPSPRARARLPADATPERVADALDDVAARLADLPRQLAGAARRGHWAPGPAGRDPGGVPMADRGPDRDGLRLDRIHVPLGPVLPDWPGGLIVDAVVQGDVVQGASVRVATGLDGEHFWDRPYMGGRPVSRAAERLDCLGRLLSVVDWRWAARRARDLRDRLVTGEPVPATEYGRFARRIRRSRLLRWMTRGVGPGGPGGDAADRIAAWLDEAGRALGGEPVPRRRVPPAGVLAELLAGAELGRARLIVASVDPDTDRALDG